MLPPSKRVSAMRSISRNAHRRADPPGVRTLDSLHVACALEFNTKQFWTFDDRHQKLAKAAALDIY